MSTPGVTLSGTLQDPSGNPSAGQVVITLVNFGDLVPLVANTMTLAEVAVTVQAASNGAWSTLLWGNYQLSPSNTFYQIQLFPSGSIVPSSSAAYVFKSGGTFDLSAIAPLSAYPGQPIPQAPNTVVTNPNATQSISTYGLEAPWFGSQSTDLAQSGAFRMGKSDTIDWRNNANTADLPLGINSSNELTFNGSPVTPLSVGWVNVKNYGALGNALVAPLNGNIGANSKTLTIGTSIQSGNPSAKFTSAMVGWTIKVPFAGTGAADLYDTIAAYVSPTQVTLINGNQTSKSLTDVDVSWWPSGASDSTAINAAISAQMAPFMLYLPAGGYPLTASITNNAYLIGIIGDGMMATSLITASQSFTGALLSLTDMPWGLTLQGFTTFGRGQVVGSGSENGIDLLNAVSKSENLVRVSDVRCAISPGYGFHGEGCIVCEFNHCIFDDCGNYNFMLDVNPNTSGGGTSCVLNGCYSYDAGNIAYYLNGYAYCSFVGCAADSNNLNYWLHNCENVGLYSCGSESPVGTGAVGYIVDGGTNILIDNCYWTQVNNANNVAVSVKNNASNVIIRNFYSHQPSITPSVDISIQSGSSNVIIENLNSVATTPISDGGTNTYVLSQGSLTKVQNITTYGNILASSDLNSNIGSSTTRFANVYTGNVYAAGTVGTRCKNTGVFGWSSTSDPTASADTGISRDSAGTIFFGNGTQDDKSAVIAASTAQMKRFDAKWATTLVSGDFSISGGWGSTASLAITNTTSKDSGGEVTITSNGTGLGANPTVTLTFHDGGWGNAPAVVACPGSTVGSYWAVTSVSSTQVQFTYIGTPAGSGQTYSLCWVAIGT